MSEVTEILSALQSGDRTAEGRLLPLVYEELRRLAAAKLSRERPEHTLQPTALVHEACLRLLGTGERPLRFDGRGHFFAAAAEAMRRILVENARRKRRRKRNAGGVRVELEDLAIDEPESPLDLLALNEALDGLANAASRPAELVKLRYFAGFTLEEAADILEISLATAKRDWAYARAWLFDALAEP